MCDDTAERPPDRTRTWERHLHCVPHPTKRMVRELGFPQRDELTNAHTTPPADPAEGHPLMPDPTPTAPSRERPALTQPQPPHERPA